MADPTKIKSKWLERIPGEIIMYGAATAPTGWVNCDGASYVRTGAYAALFAIIGTTFGAVDGSHFSVPDFRGVYPKGAGTTNRTAGKDANGNYYAATLGVYYTDQMQGHKHSVDPPSTTSGAGSNHTHTLATNVGISAHSVTNSASNAENRSHTHGIENSSIYCAAGGDYGVIGATTAQMSGNANQTHTHTTNVSVGNHTVTQPTLNNESAHTHSVDISAFDSAVPKTDGTNGAPRTGLTTEPQSIGINFIIKL